MTSWGLFQFVICSMFLTWQVEALIGQCPGTTTSKCMCQQTDDGVTCPAGYYCPAYTADQLNNSQNILAMSLANCTVRTSDGQLQCPCTPGFYCPPNTLTPSYCCAGYFCETPSVIEVCEEGHFCKTGYVEGKECGSLSNCPAGSTNYSGAQAAFAIIFVGILLYGSFLVKYFMENKVKESANLGILKLKEENAAEEEISKAAQENLSIHGEDDPLARHSIKSSGFASSSVAPSGVVVPFEIAGKAGEDVGQENPPKSTDGFSIRFDNVGLVLDSGVQIMAGVSGEFKPQRLCAIMGPSGAGKTTIINLITGKAAKTDGEITVNGEVVDDLSKWKKLVGFVPQEDIMIRQLSVRDNVEFSASYRLPVEMSDADRTKVVNDTLVSLGIDHVQHSPIGDERERGISGGQRKRVNIGIELVALPKVLFLDEPTSGLDSTSSAVLARQLKDIAIRQFVTIASVIHQPSIQAFLEFDDLLLLGRGGQVVYHGSITEAPAYFESIGFVPNGLTNPADFYLDIANGAVSRIDDPDFVPSDLFKFWENKVNGVSNLPQRVGRESELAEPVGEVAVGEKHSSGKYQAICSHTQEHAQKVHDELNPLSSANAFMTFALSISNFFWNLSTSFMLGIVTSVEACVKEFTLQDDIRNTPGYLGQLKVCFVRAFKQKYRRYGTFLSQMLIHLAVALVVSSVASDLQYVGPLPDVVCNTVTRDLYKSCTAPLVDGYQGVANFLSFGTIFAAISISTGTFGEEQVNYWRECSAGLKTAPYFIAKWLVEVPNIVLATVFFNLAFGIRFPNTNDDRDLFSLFLGMYWWSWSLGFLLSTLASPKYVFLSGVLMALIYAVAFSGVNPPMKEVRAMSPNVNWLWSISGPRWALEAFYVSQVKYYQYVPSGPLEGELYMDIAAGLDLVGYHIGDFDYDFAGLMWNGFGYGLVAMVIMMFTNRDKKK